MAEGTQVIKEASQNLDPTHLIISLAWRLKLHGLRSEHFSLFNFLASLLFFYVLLRTENNSFSSGTITYSSLREQRFYRSLKLQHIRIPHPTLPSKDNMDLGIVTHRSCMQHRVHTRFELSSKQMDHANLNCWSDVMRWHATHCSCICCV